MPIASVRRFVAWCFLLLMTSLLVACGGGAGSGSAQNTASDSLTFTMTLADGTVNNKVPLGTTASLDFVLKDGTGLPIKDATVRITVDSTVSKPVPDSGATLTDAAGKAHLAITGIKQGVDVLGVEASINGGARKVTGSLSYEIVASNGTPAPTMSLKFLDASGIVVSNLQAGVAYRAVAILTDAAGKALGGKIVSFTADTAQLTINPASGNVLTDVSGKATLVVVPTSTLGAGSVTAVSTISSGTDSVSVNGSVNYQVVAGPNQQVPTLSLALLGPGDVAQSFISVGSSYKISATVLDQFGKAGVANALVKLNFDADSVAVTPASGVMLTDSHGIATATVVAKDKLGAAAISASTDLVQAGTTLTLNSTLNYQVNASTTPTTPSLSLSLVNASGSALPDNTLPQGSSASAVATVLDPTGKPLGTPILVTFTKEASLIEFVPSTGTDLSSATTGIASVGLKASGAAGADVLTASASVTYQGKKYDLSNSVPYKVAVGAPSAAPTMNLFFSDKNGAVVAGGNTIPAGLTNYLTALVKNELGQPLANQIVTFTNSSDIASLQPESGTALTDVAGKATIGLQGSAKLGAAAVSASASVPGATGALQELTGSAAYQVVSNGSAVLPPSLSLVITDVDGVEDSTLGFGDTLTLTAKVLDNGVAVPNQTVRFALDTGSSITALLSANKLLTNSAGKASVQLSGLPVSLTASNKLVATVSAIYKGQVLTQTADILQLAAVPAVQSIVAAYASSGAALSYKGSTTLTIRLVDLSQASNPPYTLPLTLKLTSGCQAKGLASFDDAEPFVNGQGVATVTYSDLGCGKDDVVTATPNTSNGVSKSATIQLSPVPVTGTAVPASVQFVDATPTNLQIQGTGGGETSLVRFKVVDASGAAVANQTLSFSLQDENAKIATLKTTSAVTDGQGLAGASVLAGRVGGPVAVVATLASDPSLWAQSAQLLVSTRIPHQNGFSLSAAVLNPEFHDFDGETDTLTVHASDRYGNPVPDGFVVSFKTEGGIGIVQDTNNTNAPVGSCFIKDSTCSVRIKSAGNRTLLEQIGGSLNGRMTITAFARGEDSFVDVDGNGVYSSGDPYGPTVALGANTFAPPGSYRYGEPFIDANENGVHDANEEFVDFDGNGNYSDGNEGGILKYHGLGCTRTDQCSSVSTRYVYDNVILVWSGSSAVYNVQSNGSSVSSGSTLTLNAPTLVGSTCVAGAALPMTVQTTDTNGQPLPSGTTIAISIDNGTLDSTGYTIPNTNSVSLGAATNSFSVVGAITTITDATGAVTGCQTTPGTLTIKTTTPRSVVSIWTAPVQ